MGRHDSVRDIIAAFKGGGGGGEVSFESCFRTHSCPESGARDRQPWLSRPSSQSPLPPSPFSPLLFSSQRRRENESENISFIRPPTADPKPSTPPPADERSAESSASPVTACSLGSQSIGTLDLLREEKRKKMVCVPRPSEKKRRLKNGGDVRMDS